MSPSKQSPKPKSILRRWNVLRLILVALLGEIALATMNLSTMPLYLRDERHFGEGLVGVIIVGFLLSEAVFKGPFGHLADRIGPKKLMLIGPLLSVGTATLSLFVPMTNAAFGEVAIFFVLRLIDGVGSALLWPALFVAVGSELGDHERQEGLSYLNLCYMLGLALAFPIGGGANDLFGSKAAGLIMAAVLFGAAALLVAFCVPDTKPVHHDDEAAHGQFNLKDFATSLRQIPQFLILAFVTFMGIGFPLAIFKLFPIDQFGWTESKVAMLIAPGALALALLSVPVSKFGERIGRIKAVHVGMLLCVIGLGVISSGAFVPVLRLWWILAVGAIPIGVGFLLAIPAWMASVSEIDPRRRGVNIGAVMTAQGIGAIIGAPVGAKLYEALQPVGVNMGLGRDFGRYFPFVACGACILVGFLLGLKILHEPEPAPAEEA